jgi:predicted nucleic acid-binding protein
MIVLLDAGPLGMITNPKSSPENEACKNWLAKLASRGFDIVIPEIADYEVRRELLRAGPFPHNKKTRPRSPGRVERHDPICADHHADHVAGRGVLGIREKDGRQSADDASLDADMILAAQAVALNRNGDEAVIATTNVRHLSLFSSAHVWRDIS